MNIFQRIYTFFHDLLFGKPAPVLPALWPRTIPNVFEYLVKKNDVGQFLNTKDNLTERHHDYPTPLGYEVCDCVMVGDLVALQTFAFAPWKEYNIANGDGGQLLGYDDGYIRAYCTRDGGKDYIQYFVGPNYGGTGWIFFGNDPPTGMWKEIVCTLAIGKSPIDQLPLSKAFTRYRLEEIAFPWVYDGVNGSKLLWCIISEHYDGDNIHTSKVLERSYFAKGFGLIRWEAWGRTEAAPISDLNERYDYVSYSDPPEKGWYVDDVRTYTNVVKCDPIKAPDFY